MRNNGRRTWLWLLLVFPVAMSFVITPNSVVVRAQAAGHQLTEPELILQSSSKDSSPTSNKGFLTNLADKIKSLMPFKKDKEKDEDIFLVPRHEESGKLTKSDEINNVLAPFPWPIRAFVNSITQTVQSELAKEERKAKPLLKQAVKLMAADTDVQTLLGTPIKIGQMMSHSSETITVNDTTTTHIANSFEVVGSRGSGIATLQADKYAKGHIQALRVDINGVHYDITV